MKTVAPMPIENSPLESCGDMATYNGRTKKGTQKKRKIKTTNHTKFRMREMKLKLSIRLVAHIWSKLEESAREVGGGGGGGI